jgi:hypothetical protein
MPAKKRPKPIYQRGAFKLFAREDRANLEIVWYDQAAKRERSTSAGTDDRREAMLALDRRYLEDAGVKVCETCGRPLDGEASPLLTVAISDYLLLSEHKAGYASTKGRLALAIEYLASRNPSVTCAQINRKWVDGFRAWLVAKPVVAGRHTRERSLSHIEQCVLQLAAAINATPGQSAQFTNEQLRTVASSPRYRADVKMIAAMFRYCLEPEGKHIRTAKEQDTYRAYRGNLLRYLRAAIATWARPEEIYDITKAQWVSAAGVLDLNPPGRRQTRKYRGRIPIAKQFAPFLDDMGAQYIPIATVRGAWDAMRKELDIPEERGEAGMKLIRRSMATIVRKRVGEANWRQGEMMLGHVKANISDIYAIPDPANLGLVLAATEAVIDDIEKLAPGAFYRTFTADRATLRVINGGVSN